jgi:hypothetical protein
MILFKIDPQRPPLTPLEGDTPRAVDVDRVAPWHKPAQQVKIKAGLIEHRQAGHLVDRIQTHQNAAMQIGPHTGALTGLEQFPQAAVLETLAPDRNAK